MAKSSLRSQLKATSIKRLQKQIDEDNAMVGANSGEYLNLEDGKTIKIRIFPAHPGEEDFYIARKCYWLSFIGDDGEQHRGTVLDSKKHGGTKFDIVQEYVKYAKKKIGNDSEKLEALTGTGPKSNSLNPQYSWLCYADKMSGDEQLKAKIWEFKKMVRDSMNKLAFSEDEDEVIEVDPFTDPDEGLPILVSYNKNPNKKKGENFYDVQFPKKVTARKLTDDEIEYFMSLKPLSEVIGKYGIKDFERALEGLQNFDTEHEIDLFDDEDWLEHLEEIKAQYDSDSDEEDDEKPKKSTKKVVKKSKPEPEEDDEEEEEPEEESEEEDDEEESEGDEFDEMNRSALKKYITKEGLDISVKKSMSDDDIREAIRAASKAAEEDEEDDSDEEDDEEEDEEDDSSAKVSLNDIRKKLAGKK